MPYQEIKELKVTELVSQIRKGYRLSKPEGTPDERCVINIYLKLSNHLLVYNQKLRLYPSNPTSHFVLILLVVFIALLTLCISFLFSLSICLGIIRHHVFCCLYAHFHCKV